MYGERKEKNMIKTFQINNKMYTAKDFDFNLLCDLEELGLSLDDIEKKPMSLIRTYFMFSSGLTKEEAGREIEAHIANGGQLADVVNVMSDKMNESGFFRSINQRAEEGEDETSTQSQKTNGK